MTDTTDATIAGRATEAAREWLDKYRGNKAVCFCDECMTQVVPSLVGMLTTFAREERLSEAKWWEPLAGGDHEEAMMREETCPYCQRIRALEGDAGGGNDGA